MNYGTGCFVGNHIHLAFSMNSVKDDIIPLAEILEQCTELLRGLGLPA